MTIRLSICIPTYNRARFIGEAIRSALDQATDELEIVVCDNASTDDTTEVVEALFAGRTNVRYFRWDRNMGADRNYMKVVEEASGDYCWLLGSDDIIEADSVGYVLSKLKERPDLTGMTVGRNAYSFDLSKKIWMPQSRVTRLTGDAEFDSAEKTFAELGLYFGYLSTQIVHRQRWLAISESEDLTPYMKAYVHVYLIARMLKAAPHWRYLARPCVGWRSGNDSFLAAGLYNRIAIDVLGYGKIAADVFGCGSLVHRSVMRGVADVILPAGLISAKLNRAKSDFYRKLLKLCLSNFWSFPVFWWRVVPLFLMPSTLMTAVRGLYRATLKRKRLALLR